MATYNIDNLPSRFAPGDIINCPYSGTEKAITLPRGKFKLECWGADGADTYDSDTPGGIKATGGYSVGVLRTSGETLHLVCGEHGHGESEEAASRRTYNGGGRGGKNALGDYGLTIFPSGGGATHIARRGGQLADLSSYKNDVLIVAGGAAQKGNPDHTPEFSGDIDEKYNAYGGGINGGDKGYVTTRLLLSGGGVIRYSAGGTQNAGGVGAYGRLSSDLDGTGDNGEFGLGGNGSSHTLSHGPGGGGGWYGGGGGFARWVLRNLYIHQIAMGASGGSGHIGALESGTTYNPGAGVPTNPDSAGHGYIRVTVISLFDVPVKVNGAWKHSQAGYVKVNGAWKNISDVFTKINGVWKRQA